MEASLHLVQDITVFIVISSTLSGLFVGTGMSVCVCVCGDRVKGAGVW